MKPVNEGDLRSAYVSFLLYFITLLIFSVIAVYLFFLTSNREVAILNDKVKESEKLITVRADINNNFDIILQRMQQLSQYTRMNAEELNNQNILLNDIQESNQKIQDKLQQNQIHLKSFELYKKLSDNVSAAANIKDSLFTTRFQIESLRSQLESCNKTNTSAVNRIRDALHDNSHDEIQPEEETRKVPVLFNTVHIYCRRIMHRPVLELWQQY